MINLQKMQKAYSSETLQQRREEVGSRGMIRRVMTNLQKMQKCKKCRKLTVEKAYSKHSSIELQYRRRERSGSMINLVESRSI